MIKIVEITSMDDEVMQAMGRLVPQLTANSPMPERDHIKQIVQNPNSILFAARSEDENRRIIGFLTLVVYPIPTGIVGWIEDVVVDEAARGQGAGEALTRAALERAQSMGAKSVSLTSRPTREAANRLYQRVGFAKPETNFYRYTFEKK